MLIMLIVFATIIAEYLIGVVVVWVLSWREFGRQRNQRHSRQRLGLSLVDGVMWPASIYLAIALADKISLTEQEHSASQYQ